MYSQATLLITKVAIKIIGGYYSVRQVTAGWLKHQPPRRRAVVKISETESERYVVIGHSEAKHAFSQVTRDNSVWDAVNPAETRPTLLLATPRRHGIYFFKVVQIKFMPFRSRFPEELYAFFSNQCMETCLHTNTLLQAVGDIGRQLTWTLLFHLWTCKDVGVCKDQCVRLKRLPNTTQQHLTHSSGINALALFSSLAIEFSHTLSASDSIKNALTAFAHTPSLFFSLCFHALSIPVFMLGGNQTENLCLPATQRRYLQYRLQTNQGSRAPFIYPHSLTFKQITKEAGLQ